LGKIISVEKLNKTFKFKVKSTGFSNSIRSLIKPVYKTVYAVNNISFDVSEGELLGFIGPNGAGKSTTIKILTGILYPTSGKATVCGIIPWEQRQKLAFQIGSVFGQRPQLWYHLPALETFNLFSKIYELDRNKYKNKLNWLIDKFQIKEYLNTPVRKLSLGQRMRCEVVASLIHSPEVIFLDEPTIGLDVVAKQEIRNTIKEINKEEGTTIFLTSHDVGDIEKVTKRTIIINNGEIIFDGETRILRWDFLHSKIISVKFKKDNIKKIDLDGVKILKQSDLGTKLEVDTSVMEIETVLKFILQKHKIADININDPPLEDIIAYIYKEKNAPKSRSNTIK